MTVLRDWLQSRRLATMPPRGEMAERTKATVSKTVESYLGFRGFKSHSLRHRPVSPPACGGKVPPANGRG